MPRRRLAYLLPFALTFGCGPGTVESGGPRPGGGPDLRLPPQNHGGDGGALPVCEDQDGDGYGLGCPLGPDCNEQDAKIHKDCPNVGGDIVTEVRPFDPKEDGSQGVKLDGNGGVVLDPGNFQSTQAPIIWVANSSEGTVSKIDTRTLKEVGRYTTGPKGNGNDPSRTTVGLSGDVVVANRFGHAATKIAADPSRCVDKNGNGKIDTSTGAGDVRPWGDDECVLWHTQFPNGSIARAAAFDAQLAIDGDDISTVWIGLYGLSQMRQLDSKNGQEIATVDVGARPYGAAIDKDQNVWVQGTGVIVKIDANKKVTKLPTPPCAYGITVDSQGRPWVAGQSCVARYNPQQGRWDNVRHGGFNRGLAADAKGSVWVADTDFGVHQIDQNTLQVRKDIPLGNANFVGMAIDFDGRVWAISQGAAKAYRIDPQTYQVQNVQVGRGPYTYSDMTGFQLRAAAAPFGNYRHTFQGCAKDARYTSLAWQAQLPPGTSLTLKVRVGDDPAALAQAPWVPVASAPPDGSPVNLETKLGGKNVGALLQVDVTFKAVSDKVTPILQSLAATMSCVQTPG